MCRVNPLRRTRNPGMERTRARNAPTPDEERTIVRECLENEGVAALITESARLCAVLPRDLTDDAHAVDHVAVALLRLWNRQSRSDTITILRHYWEATLNNSKARPQDRAAALTQIQLTANALTAAVAKERAARRERARPTATSPHSRPEPPRRQETRRKKQAPAKTTAPVGWWATFKQAFTKSYDEYDTGGSSLADD